MFPRSSHAAHVRAGSPTAEPDPARARFNLSQRQIYAILTIILLLATGLRLYRITVAPPGLYLDEAADGASAVQAWETGHFRVFYPEDNGREGLYINIASVFVHFWGSKPWVLRLPAVIFGVLTVAGIYALTVELLSPHVGLAAAFFLATSYWHMNFSRIAFRAIAAPFFLVWALYFLLLAFRRLREGNKFAAWAALAGVTYGAGFHTYIAYRVTPVLVIVALSFLFVEASRCGRIRQFWTGLVLFATGAVVAVYPLIAYLVGHRGIASARLNQVSILESPSLVRDIAGNIWKTVGMLYWLGDTNWRHNYAGRPEVVGPVALLMTLGIALAIRKMFVRSSPGKLLAPVLLLLWILCGAIPAVLSNEGIPHALRSILMLPPIVIFAAMGAAGILSAAPPVISPSILTVAVIAIACALTGETAYRYFDQWAKDPSTPAWFDGKNAVLADQINSLPQGQAKVVAIFGPSEAADPFFLPLISLRFLTNSVTLKQQEESHIHYYTPLTFPFPLPAVSNAADFCAEVKAAMPAAAVVCLAL